MTYLITYKDTEKIGEHPKTIVHNDVARWVTDNPKAYIIMCQPLESLPIKVAKQDIGDILKLNKR